MHTARDIDREKIRHNRQYKGTSHKTPGTITRCRHFAMRAFDMRKSIARGTLGNLAAILPIV